ncbi:MAG TPA: alpha/beta hydrolase [Crenalkalicoccus sp.]|nr:alpha/beta hydrolase [Crenalkalicoccus sp.]
MADGFARHRDVILFNDAGISSTSGEVPNSIEGMAANAAAFIKALGPTKVDVLGFSLGGLVGIARQQRHPFPVSGHRPMRMG